MNEKLIEVMARAASDVFCKHAEYTEDQIEEHWQRNKQSYIEEQTAALAALHSAGYAVVPVDREFICKGCGLRIDTNEKPKEPLF